MLRVFKNCWQPCKPGAWMVLSRLYHNDINNCLPSMPLWRVSWCQQSTVYVQVKILEHTALINKAAVLRVNLNPQTIICDIETVLIPAIQSYFPNTRVQGCCFHICRAVHTKALCKNSLINVFSNK
ncbi:hypothetical protein T07_7811 [Trichinella nelsoni]|uniref:Uncharacterized protein n=1 Tax=Trichinella nelsoni TaxID=6336 RepID=A0A0V0RJC3_9BILA|nr:hypothetical protein T07_7811 [Trichinella nelsoni]